MSAQFSGNPLLTPTHRGVAIVAPTHQGIAAIAASRGAVLFRVVYSGLIIVFPEVATMADIQLLVNSTNLVQLKKFKDVTDGTFPEDATVTCTVRNQATGAVVGSAQDIPMPRKAGTSGAETVYEGSIDEDVPFVAGTKYEVEVRAIRGTNQRSFYLTATAVKA